VNLRIVFVSTQKIENELGRAFQPEFKVLIGIITQNSLSQKSWGKDP